MKMLPLTIIAVTLAAFSSGPSFAQATSPSMTPVQEQTVPSSQNPSDQSSSTAKAADLTGQAIYNSAGRQIGIVSSVSTDAQGQQVAIVSVEKFLGMGGKSVQMPLNSLLPKDGGGYSTALTDKEIKALSQGDVH